MELEYEGELHGSDRIARELIAAAAGFIAARRSGRMIDSLVVGYPVLWAVTALM